MGRKFSEEVAVAYLRKRSNKSGNVLFKAGLQWEKGNVGEYSKENVTPKSGEFYSGEERLGRYKKSPQQRVLLCAHQQSQRKGSAKKQPSQRGIGKKRSTQRGEKGISKKGACRGFEGFSGIGGKILQKTRITKPGSEEKTCRKRGGVRRT